MKRLIQILITFSMFCGCQDRLSSVGLELSESIIECSSEGGEFQIVTSGRPDWVTDNTSDWISIRKVSNSAVITIDHNTGGNRSRTISFMLDGLSSASLEIRQAHSDEFSIEKDQVSFGYKGGSVTIGITCFDVWKASSGVEWIHLDKTEGHEPHMLGITIDPNPSSEDREGKIAISNSDKTLTINILQALHPIVEVEREEAYFDGDGGYTDILYMCNTDVNVICTDPWIRLIKNDSNINKVSFEVLRNLGEPRVGKIRVESVADNEIFKEITITQGPKIDHPALSFKEGNSLVLESKKSITIHPVFTDMTDFSLDWKSDNPEIAEVDQKGNVTIHNGGLCVISATNYFHNLEASIILYIKPKAESMVIMFGTQNMKEVPVAVRFPGEKNTLSVIMYPSDSYADDIVYFSSDSEVGEIIGHTLYCRAEGTATIYAESLYQGIRESFTLIVRE